MISDVDINSFINNVTHSVHMAFSSCQVQRSQLLKRKTQQISSNNPLCAEESCIYVLTPALSSMLKSAPLWMRQPTVYLWPLSAAMCRGVFWCRKESNHAAYVGGSKAMLTFGKGLIVTYTEGDMNRNPSGIIKHTYPILVTNVDFSSFLNKAVHCVLVASFSCQMQWSPLMERPKFC